MVSRSKICLKGILKILGFEMMAECVRAGIHSNKGIVKIFVGWGAPGSGIWTVHMYVPIYLFTYLCTHTHTSNIK